MARPARWLCLLAICAVVGCATTARCAARGREISRTGKARAASPFAIRGIKGLWWKGIENYRLALPWLAKHHLNFLMLCYTSFPASATDWRSDYTPEELAQIKDLAEEADRLGVHLCLSFNPGIWSKPPLCYSSESDYQRALAKVKQIHALGVDWFGLCLDDIDRALTPEDQQRFGTLQAAQVSFVNRLWRDMQTLRPAPKLIFCPSAYTTADAARHPDYIRTIGKEIDPGVMMFWTGPTVRSASITAADARRFAGWIERKPFVWDNYPVNDDTPWRPHLAAVKARSADLASEVSGYMANPMKQWYASTLPLATLADYLSDPSDYDPNLSVQRLIDSYAPEQRPAIIALMQLYGIRFLGEPGYPQEPRPRNRESAARMLPQYLHLKDLLSADLALKDLWEDVRPTLEADIALLERKSRDRQKDSPLRAEGDDFVGGAGAIYGVRWFGRNVNFVYARSTGRSSMRVDFWLGVIPPSGAELALTCRDDDSGKKLKVRITLNSLEVVDGESPFSSDGFQTRMFAIPASALKVGRNSLAITNVEKSGPLGMPPWFMVAEAGLRPRF